MSGVSANLCVLESNATADRERKGRIEPISIPGYITQETDFRVTFTAILSIPNLLTKKFFESFIFTHFLSDLNSEMNKISLRAR